jgi:hypothetical protein
MALLLVDDRDDRIVAVIQTEDEAQRVVSAWADNDGTLPEYLCLVAVNSSEGVLFGTDRSVKVAPLT